MRKVHWTILPNIHDVNDGCGGQTGSCRLSTLLHDQQDSEHIGWIRGHSKIGPVHQNVEMMSSTSGEQSHAVRSSIEETHASKPQAKSSLVSYPSKEFIQVDERKWNDILLLAMMSTSILLTRKFRKD